MQGSHLRQTRNFSFALKRSIRALAPRVLVSLFFILSGAASTTHAQGNLCSAPAPKYPCLDQPTAGDVVVTGKLGPTPGESPAIKLDVNGATPPGLSTKINADGSFTVSGFTAIAAGVNITVTQTSPADHVGATYTTNAVSVAGDSNSSKTTIIMIGGWEQAGYSSLGQNGNAFINFFFDGPNDHRFSGWGRVRLLSAPQPSTQGIASTFTDPTGQITTKSFADVGQAMDFLVGPRLSLGEHWSLIADFGATTPLSSQNVAVTYNVPQQGTAECNELPIRFSAKNGYNPPLVAAPAGAGTCLEQGYKYLAFANQDRSNFLLKYGAGARTSYPIPCNGTNKGKSACSPSYSVLDITLGQDESITGGKLRSVVFKLDGILPIPTGDSSWLYLFGSVYMRLNRNQNLSPLILTTATGVTIPSPSVVVLPLAQPNRDYYRLGVGINLSQIFCKLSTTTCPNKGSGDTKTNGTANKLNAL